MKAVRFRELQLQVGELEEAAAWLVELARAPGPPLWVAHVNVHNYYHLARRPSGARDMRRCRLLMDGIGMKVGAWISGLGWLPDVSGTDLFPEVMQRAQRAGVSVYLLGATTGVLARAVSETRLRFPRLSVAGHGCGYFGRGRWSGIFAAIRESGADIVVVSRGSPIPEDFLAAALDGSGARVVWDVGGLFDFVSGAKPRAPRAWRRLRLEWLFRLMLEPSRMWHRNLVAAPWFLVHVTTSRLLRAVRGESAADASLEGR